MGPRQPDSCSGPVGSTDDYGCLQQGAAGLDQAEEGQPIEVGADLKARGELGVRNITLSDDRVTFDLVLPKGT